MRFFLLCIACFLFSFGTFADENRQAYTLDSGDKLRIIVYGEEDLTGEFELDGLGHLSLPLIGTVAAEGLTVQALEARLQKRYADGYLVRPRISVEVLTFRPFYIMGEVNEPGDYPYTNGMTVLNAVAVAGGYTYRADKDDIDVKRQNSEGTQTFAVDEHTLVQPGDVIHVQERFF